MKARAWLGIALMALCVLAAWLTLVNMFGWPFGTGLMLFVFVVLPLSVRAIVTGAVRLRTWNDVRRVRREMHPR